MTTVMISDGKLMIEIQGWDKLWALKSSLEIPLEHVKGVRSGKDERVRGIRAPGTHWPGIIAAGSFHQIGKHVFWDVHHEERAIAIDLHDERYTTLIVEVEHPEVTISEIERAISSLKS